MTGESVTADRQSASAAFARAPAISRAETLWLVAILAVAAVLRFYKLDSSLWYDEVDTLVAWHERIGERRDRVTIRPGAATTINFTLPVLEPGQ